MLSPERSAERQACARRPVRHADARLERHAHGIGQHVRRRHAGNAGLLLGQVMWRARLDRRLTVAVGASIAVHAALLGAYEPRTATGSSVSATVLHALLE